MTTATSKNNTSDTPVLTFCLSIVALIAAGILADWLSFGANTSSAAMGIAALTPNGVSLFRQHRRTDRQEELDALTRGNVDRPPLLVVGVLGPALLILDSLYGAMIGVAVSVSVGVTGGDPSQASGAVGLLGLIVGAPLLILTTFVLAQYAAHFLARRKTLWLAVSVGMYLALRLLIIVIAWDAIRESGFVDASLVLFLVALVIVALVMIFISWLGKLRADSTHPQFVMARLFRKLGAVDRLAALELLRETVMSPSAAQPNAVAPEGRFGTGAAPIPST